MYNWEVHQNLMSTCHLQQSNLEFEGKSGESMEASRSLGKSLARILCLSKRWK